MFLLLHSMMLPIAESYINFKQDTPCFSLGLSCTVGIFYLGISTSYNPANMDWETNLRVGSPLCYGTINYSRWEGLSLGTTIQTWLPWFVHPSFGIECNLSQRTLSYRLGLVPSFCNPLSWL